MLVFLTGTVHLVDILFLRLRHPPTGGGGWRITKSLTRSSSAPCIRRGTCHNLKILAANHEFLVTIARYGLPTEAVHPSPFADETFRVLRKLRFLTSKFVILASEERDEKF